MDNSADHAADWAVAPQTGLAADGRPRLFCLPHAGGDGSGFLTWARPLRPRVEVLPVVLPGRGKRHREEPATHLQRLARSLAAMLAPLAGGPYALFGHSLGALLAFEMARELGRAGRPPRLLIASGSPSPPRAAEHPEAWHLLPDEAFLDVVLAAGGTPPDVLAEPELRQLLLPRLRADYTMAETYRYGGGLPLPCPILTYAGSADDQIHGDVPEDWARVSTWGRQPARRFPGGHFYLEECRPAVLEAIRTDLADAFGDDPSTNDAGESIEPRTDAPTKTGKTPLEKDGRRG
ncbi:thioesterase [Streptomyces sp. V2]|uniref:thioesterase II family protein n=1 Tax=Streptomyces TaxID=1883 RepID=UPI0006EBB037|nr:MULTISPECIES: alpha/beta fold hydrolase [Streptomyces]PWG13315.1 thioesterase [Streptomyces sp. V2]